MLVSDFDFHLPEELIAQAPLASRSASRLLHLRRETGKFDDRKFLDLPDLLCPDDLLVLNNSRVFPARLFGHRSGLHAQPVSPHNPAAKDFLQGRVEVLLTRQLAPLEWQALVRPGKKIGVGERISFGANGDLKAEITARGDFGERTLRFKPVPDFFALVDKLGHVPLPPYIRRPNPLPFPTEDQPQAQEKDQIKDEGTVQDQNQENDKARYQTVYARPDASGSVAAPTAGLHFTPEVLTRIRERGIELAEITLHVGLGTFQPVHVAQVEAHRMHSERFVISESAAAQINRALEEKRRVVAVGTTTVRTLEYLAAINKIQSGSGEADIFIYPGFSFRVVGAMLTNFHLPQSTLLMLVSAFAGRENILRAYAHAVQERYRFFSYGDCMFVE